MSSTGRKKTPHMWILYVTFSRMSLHNIVCMCVGVILSVCLSTRQRVCECMGGSVHKTLLEVSQAEAKLD